MKSVMNEIEITGVETSDFGRAPEISRYHNKDLLIIKNEMQIKKYK